MNDTSLNFLKKLLDSPSPSGFEQPSQKIWREYVKKFSDEVKTDVMGNSFAYLNGVKKKPLIMLAGHCDEIGLMVKYIDEKGFIYFSTIGGIDPHLIPCKRVKIHTKKGAVLGVVGKKPIHWIDAKDREKVIPIKDQFIDIGVSSEKEAKKYVSIGDPITFALEMETLKNNNAVARAFDNKMGCFIVAEVLRLIRKSYKKKPASTVVSVATVQEEIGLRGATTSAYSINPDVGIAIDVGFATDHPDIDKKQVGDFSIGKGPIIARGPNVNPKIFDMLTEIAGKNKIPYQVDGISRETGTDAAVIQLSRNGVAAGLISIPLRYMHTSSEVLNLLDLVSASKLLAEFVFAIDERTNFIP